MRGNPKRPPLADRIRKGLEEAIRHAKGEITLKTTVVELPDPPPQIQADELTRLWLSNQMSQDVFARILNVSTKTVQSWEDGTRKPSQAALRLIQVFRHDPAGVLRVSGMTDAQALASPNKQGPRVRSKKSTSTEVTT
jgi:putative transcriptional regulator